MCVLGAGKCPAPQVHMGQPQGQGGTRGAPKHHCHLDGGSFALRMIFGVKGRASRSADEEGKITRFGSLASKALQSDSSSTYPGMLSAVYHLFDFL